MEPISSLTFVLTRSADISLVGCLVRFYGISTFVGYLMPNPFLYKQSVLFQTIQFILGIKKHFYFKLFSFVRHF